MGTIDVSPDSLRTSGEQVAATADGFQGAAGSAMLMGAGEHTTISEGLFEPGAEASQQASNNAFLQTQVNAAIETSMRSISSALYGMADLFSNTDLENGMKFMFGVDGASRPGGLPPHIDPDVMMVGGADDAYDFDASENYTLDDLEGHESNETTNTEHFRDGDGNVVHTRTSTTNEDTGTTSHVVENGATGEVRYYTTDADGNTLSSFTVEKQEHAHGLDEFVETQQEYAAAEQERIEEKSEQNLHGVQESPPTGEDGEPTTPPDPYEYEEGDYVY
ncbi:hypothetical protein EV191_104151 [Tamaricihabitans halophyticus]|uniref:Uncharacterized protein n=1 Tax=Tamaricihabitans halophyticus TaxID=1262583 RepID=A0A4R2QWE1_9PSEU|nr:hypothetical protein [Tamaricihabitans halophyticus]TCP53584.1 hypothetical protein EV191_104151 [Tamaricihabitans halophyticus]